MRTARFKTKNKKKKKKEKTICCKKEHLERQVFEVQKYDMTDD